MISAPFAKTVCRALLLSLPLLAHAGSVAQKDFSRIVALTPDAGRGSELFTQCAACHGPDGNGTVNGSIPRIAGQHYRVLVRQIVDFRNGARWDVRMEGVATSHEIIPELQDIADVASYVSTLSRDGARGVGDGQHVERGATIYGPLRFLPRRAGAGRRPRRNSADRRPARRLPGAADLRCRRRTPAAADTKPCEAFRSRSMFEEVLGLSDYLARIGWSDPETWGAVAEVTRQRALLQLECRKSRHARTVCSSGALRVHRET